MVLSHIKIRQNLKLSVLKLETHYNILLRPTNKLQPGRMFPSNFFECYFFHKLRADPFLACSSNFRVSGRFSSPQQVFFFRWKTKLFSCCSHVFGGKTKEAQIVRRWNMILLMVQKSWDQQLRLVVYPMIYKVSAPSQPGGDRRISEPSTVLRWFLSWLVEVKDVWLLPHVFQVRYGA